MYPGLIILADTEKNKLILLADKYVQGSKFTAAGTHQCEKND